MSEQSEWSAYFSSVGSECRDWWIELTDADPATGSEKAAGANPDHVSLAALRRIGVTSDGQRVHVDLVTAATAPAYGRLRERLSGLATTWRQSRDWDWLAPDQGSDERVAIVAASLADVREDLEARTAAAGLGRKRFPDERPLMAQARFKRLLRARTRPDLLLQARHVVTLLEHKVSVADLGASLLLWGAVVQRRWTFAYADKPDPDAGT